MNALLSYGNQLLIGLSITIALAAVSILVGCLLGGIGAWMKLSGGRLLRVAVGAYTNLIRGLPDLLLVLIIYFGGTAALGSLFGRYVEVSPFVAGVVALGIVFGGYATETMRAAVLAVSDGQREAGISLGLSRRQAFWLVQFPQAVRHALPGLGNLSIVLLKETSLVSVVGLEELMRKSAIAAGATREPFVFYAAAAALYLCVTGLMTLGLNKAEARAARGFAGG